MDCEVLVIGGGAAGCIAASKLASKQVKTALVTAGTPATAMSPGRVQMTTQDPYGPELQKFLQTAGAPYGLFTNNGETTAWTNKGTLYQQSLSALYDHNMDATAVAGIENNKDLDPTLFAKMVHKVSRQELSNHWLPAGDLDTLAAGLQEISADKIIIPPLFDLRHYQTGMQTLADKCGRQLCEAATPLAHPGRRLSECLLQAAKTAGVQVLAGRRVTEITGSTARILSGLREQTIEYQTLLLASGNLVSGGLMLDGNLVREPLLGLNVTEVHNGKLRSAALTEALAAGICAHGCRAAAGVYACGSLVAGLSYPFNKGLWEVMLNAWKTAETIQEAL